MSLSLAILRLAKAGVAVTFNYRGNESVASGLPGTPDTYYTLTTRAGGQDYKRTEIPRNDITTILHQQGEAGLDAYLEGILNHVSR